MVPNSKTIPITLMSLNVMPNRDVSSLLAITHFLTMILIRSLSASKPNFYYSLGTILIYKTKQLNMKKITMKGIRCRIQKQFVIFFSS